VRQVWRHQLLFLACYFFWMSSVQAESSISGDKGGSTTIGDASATNNVALNNSAFAIANYRTLESLEPPLFRDGFEGNTPPVPTGNCDAPSLGGVTVDWSAFWDGAAFPDPVFKDIFTSIPRNGYLAIEFNAANYVDTGLLTTIESTATSGRRLGAISQCPGDFDVTDKCRHIWGVGGEIFWSTQGYSKACILEPNTTYYFNVTFTDGVDPASSECVNANCITKIRAKNP